MRFDDGSRALYATDASNYRQVPIGVVLPRDADDVVATVALARKHGAPILARGGGTSLAGQCCNVAVVLDFSKYMHSIRELNAERKVRARRAGHHPRRSSQRGREAHAHLRSRSRHAHPLHARRDDRQQLLRRARADGRQDRRQHRRAGDPHVRRRAHARRADERRGARSDHRRGRAARRDLRGHRSASATRYADLIRAKYPKIPRRVSGYNLDALLPENGFNVAQALVGSECTCVVVLEAKCRLVYSPPSRTLVVLGYDDIYEAADDVPRLLEFKPIGLEGIDDRLIDDMKAKGLQRRQDRSAAAGQRVAARRIRRRDEGSVGRLRANDDRRR